MRSELAVAEVLRAVRRVDGDVEVALAHLDSLDQLVIDRNLLLAAGRLGPDGLRSAGCDPPGCSRARGHDLGGVVTYDSRISRSGAELLLAPD